MKIYSDKMESSTSNPANITIDNKMYDLFEKTSFNA